MTKFVRDGCPIFLFVDEIVESGLQGLGVELANSGAGTWITRNMSSLHWADPQRLLVYSARGFGLQDFMTVGKN